MMQRFFFKLFFNENKTLNQLIDNIKDYDYLSYGIRDMKQISPYSFNYKDLKELILNVQTRRFFYRSKTRLNPNITSQRDLYYQQQKNKKIKLNTETEKSLDILVNMLEHLINIRDLYEKLNQYDEGKYPLDKAINITDLD